MPDKPVISFIICTYNRAEYLRDTLHSLLQIQAAPQQFELLVIDNRSSDHTPAVVDTVCKENPKIQIRHIKESKQGLSYARNRGVKEAAAKNLVFLDDDISAQTTLIPAWFSFFQKYPNALAGGGKIHVQFDNPRPPWMSHFLMPLLGHHDLGNSIKKYPANKYPFGGNMGFRKKVFDQFGRFNTELGRKGNQLKASEEKEFFNRIRHNRDAIYYLPEAFLYHRVNKNRLTIKYIRQQAIGLGQSMALQWNQDSIYMRLKKIAAEATKWIASLFLFFIYTLALQYPKARMLMKFRWWIWRGYKNDEL